MKKFHAKSKIAIIFLLLFLFTFISLIPLNAQSVNLSVEGCFKPRFVPVDFCLNYDINGELSASASIGGDVLVTPIGTFSIGVSISTILRKAPKRKANRKDLVVIVNYDGKRHAYSNR